MQAQPVVAQGTRHELPVTPTRCNEASFPEERRTPASMMEAGALLDQGMVPVGPASLDPLDQVHDPDIAPFARQSLGDEAAVALFRGVLAAKQTGRFGGEGSAVEDARDVTLIHERLEAAEILLPIVIVAVFAENLLRRRKQRLVNITASMGQLVEEKG